MTTWSIKNLNYSFKVQTIHEQSLIILRYVVNTYIGYLVLNIEVCHCHFMHASANEIQQWKLFGTNWKKTIHSDINGFQFIINNNIIN